MRMKYNLVDTIDKLKSLDKILMDGDKARYPILSYDTETNGIPLYKTTVVGFSISFNKDSGYYIPLLKWVSDPASKYIRSYKKQKYEAYKHGWLECVWTGERFDEFVTPQEYNIKERFPFIPALVERWLTSTNLYMWNAPFDVNHTFINMGVELKNNLFLDGGLLVHALDENFSVALKPNAEKYKEYLGINPHAQATMEKKELIDSIIRNGGTPSQVWRADLEPQSKYGCADAFFTFGICEKATQDFAQEYGDKGLNWFFNQEVMPVCKEVVIDMKRRGAYIDVPYFQKLHDETQLKMFTLEDQIINELQSSKLLDDFSVGDSMEDAISKQAIVKKIIELEGLAIPLKTDKAGVTKETLAKAEVKKEYAKNPHWLWGYILGEDEIKYSDEKLNRIKQELYVKKIKRRYRFNIGSSDHLRWLFCDKLGMNKKKLPQTDSATKDNPIPSMGAEILEEHMLPHFPFVATLMSWKKLQKMNSTYIKPALVMNINGWLYVDWKQNGTTSGRFSCSGGYNLQTLPRVDDEMEILEACDQCESSNVEILQEIECIADRKCLDCGRIKKDIARPSAIKKGFVAPPGYKIVNADYSSLEPRCFAVMSGEEALKEVYRKGLDLYSQVYCEIFDVEGKYSADPNAPNYLKKIAKAKRNWIKPVVLGIPYGAEDGQVAMLIGAMKEVKDKKTGEIVTKPDYAEGKRVRDAFLGKLGNLRQYMEDQEIQAVKLGYVETIVGRRRHLPYAKKINDVLEKYDIDYKDLKDSFPFQLKSKTCTFVHKLKGIRFHFPEEALLEIQESLGIKDDKLVEKGYWVYIRNLLKADLNNAKNNPIQGLAGHITNKGMLDTTRSFKQQGLNAWVSLQVHDEIAVYAAIEQSTLGSKCLKNGMEKNEFTALLDIPMIADPVICDNLKESK